MTKKTFSRVKIDAQLRNKGLKIKNTNTPRLEHPLPDCIKADYVLCDRDGHLLAVGETVLYREKAVA